MVTNVLAGMQHVQQQGELGRQQGQQRRVQGLAPQILAGDPQAFDQAAAIDPQAAQQYQNAGDGQLRRLKGALNYFEEGLKSGNDQLVQARFKEISPFLSKATGKPAPPAYTPDMLPAFEQLKMKIAMADQGAGNDLKSLRIGKDGFYYAIQGGQLVNTGIQADARTQLRDQPGIAPGLVDLRTGQVNALGAASQEQPPVASAGQGDSATNVSIEGIAPERQQQLANVASTMRAAGVDEDRIAKFISESLSQPQTVNAPAAAAATPAQSDLTAPRPAIAPAEQQRLALAEQANQRAAEASQRATDAAEMAKRGNAPAGFRFKADGSLEPIPGGPKPAGAVASEDERKAAAWLAQSRNAYQNMVNVIGKDPAAAEPGFLETYVPNDELANRSRSDTRQQYVQAASSLSEALLRAATGAGVNRDEAVQKIRELTPQRGDSAAVRQQKLDAIPVYLDALQARAGRAAPGVQSSPSAAASVQRARNPQTGEVLVLRNGQWVPE